MKRIDQQPSERSIFFWNILGSLFNALLSVIILLIVTRFLASNEADIFNIAWTISQLMATIGTYQIRMYQATDVREKFSFNQYLRFRFITIGLMLIISVIYVFEKGYSPYKAWIVFLICIFRAVEALAEVFEGRFQQKERLDLVGKAITYRIVITIISFFVVLQYTRDLVASCITLVLCYVLCFFVYNVRYYQRWGIESEKRKWGIREFKEMIIAGAPLFINAFLMMSITNTPKMVIDKYVEQDVIGAGIQTIFGVLFLPASFLSLAYIVFRPLITKMAIVWQNGRRDMFLKILCKIIFGLFGIAIVLLLGTATLGCPILSFVYGVDLSAYRLELLIIVLGGCLYTFAIIIDNAMIVMRKQYLLIIAYVVSWLFVKIAADYMFKQWQLTGISALYLVGMGIFLAVTVILFMVAFWKAKKRGNNENE